MFPVLNRNTSDYIPVEPFTEYVISNVDSTEIFVYDKDKNFVRDTNVDNDNTFKTYAFEKYVRISMRNTVDISTLQVEKGDTTTPYEEFGYKIPNLIIDSDISHSKTKIPKNSIVWEDTGSTVNMLARSYDGNLWGMSNSRLFKSTDGGETLEIGERMLSHIDTTSEEVATICAFSEDKIIVTITSGRVLRFNGLHDDDPEEILNTDGIRTLSLATNYYSDGINEYIFVGEYDHTNAMKRMWASKDGGDNFFVQKEGTTDNPEDYGSGNNHWHSVAYDPYAGAVWMCQGDGLNRRHFVTYNWGESFTEFRDGEHQPTLILPFPKRVVFGRDNLTPGASEILRSSETLDLVNKFSFREEYNADMFYPSYQPILHTGQEAYILFRNQGTSDGMSYIYGTGDGGDSWHMLYSTTESLSSLAGIVNGYIFIRQSGGSLKRAKVEWV